MPVLVFLLDGMQFHIFLYLISGRSSSLSFPCVVHPQCWPVFLSLLYNGQQDEHTKEKMKEKEKS